MTERPKKPATRTGHRAPTGYDTTDYPTFSVTVDVVNMSVVDGQLMVLLVRRQSDPYEGAWALPGGFKHPIESLDDAAARELREETGVDAPRHLAQFGSYGDPGRDPRGNVVTVGYLAVTPEVGRIEAGTDADDAQLWPVADVLDGEVELAFDHEQILRDAIGRAGGDLEGSDLATAFVGPTFTLSELQSVYEAIWDDELDTANFRRSLSMSPPDSSYVVATGERAAAGPKGGRPPELFAAGDAWTDGSPVRRSKRRGTKPRRGGGNQS
ncbi:NUDIX hydrolase [Ilumatobacter sp.]|uniref:NUDIX hydrolase n=1 Tax=Ilumatobacter sp. TaxID=1967498 RepID=UPI003C3B3C79